jgi:hypothetical protein
MKNFVMFTLCLMLLWKHQGIVENAADYWNPSSINNVKACAVLNWFRIASISGLLLARQWVFEFHNSLGFLDSPSNCERVRKSEHYESKVAPPRAMTAEAYGVSRRTSILYLQSSLDLALDVESDQLHAPAALHPGKELP